MPPGHSLDWLWDLGAAALGGLGLALLLWALFWDRARGRRRCPKCWYDMAGVPASGSAADAACTCPECGHMARGERGLSRTRRRWRAAAAGGLLMAAAYALWCVPGWRDGGWTTLVPNQVLVFIAPPENPPPGPVPA